MRRRKACSKQGPGPILIAASFVLVRDVSAAQLPVPCVTASCGTQGGPNGFVTSGAASALQSGNKLTINQTSSNAVLNWSSFNVSANGQVVFQQPSANSIALNRIYQASPSAIFGQLTANGQIYLVNPNGIVFGSTASVNVAGLIASSLGISDSVFQARILSPTLTANRTPELASVDGRLNVLDGNGQPVLDGNGQPIPVAVTVQAGAQINAAPNGRILLASPIVQNSGSIQAPNGQIILAAGQAVYLEASSDPALRGLLVEVDGSGAVSNQLTGKLSAATGNISLVGLAVNQDGLISATTTENGSVRLEAGNTTTVTSGASNTTVIASSVGGTVTLGPSSDIQVLPDFAGSSTAVAAQTQLPSQVTILGQQVLMQGGSITVPGGTLSVTAAANPGAGVTTDGNSAAKIRIDAGTTIDLSGSAAELPMSANLVTVELRGPEFADDPNQRNGALRGDTVVIDSRVGTPIANVASDIAAVPLTLAQRTETGGTASFESEGDVVFGQGASINVSGGHTTYDSGVLQTTQLVGANGKLYGIGSANPLLTYTCVVNPNYTLDFNRWGVQQVNETGAGQFESGYVQGAAAGRVQFAAPAMVLNGNLLGTAVNGPLQRTPSTMVPGGQLIIGLPGGLPGGTQLTADYLAPAVNFSATPPRVDISDDASLPNFPVSLPVGYLANGFTQTSIYSNSIITLPAGLPLVLTPGSSFLLSAPRVDVLSDITDRGGGLTLQSVDSVLAADYSVARAEIDIGAGVTLDVSGQWINDSLLAAGTPALLPELQNGGSIKATLAPLATVAGGQLVLGDNASLLADGGAWVNSTNKITGGAGGSIALDATAPGSALQLGHNVQVSGFGVNGAAGGTFSLGAPSILISQGTGGWTSPQRVDASDSGAMLQVYAPLFSNYGFSQVDLQAAGILAPGDSGPDSLEVQSGTSILASVQSRQLDSSYLTRPTGGTVDAFTKVVALPVLSRPVMIVSLSIDPQAAPVGFAPPVGATTIGALDVQNGASIATDPGGKIYLTGAGGISVGGTLRAPAGTLSLNIPTPAGALDTGYLPDIGISLGSHALLDASGTSELIPNDLGLLLGNVYAGGSVTLAAQRGSIITQPGSAIDIAGVTTALDVQTRPDSGLYSRQLVPSAGGSLIVRAPESISLRGLLLAAAGTGGAVHPDGGSLEIDLTRADYGFTFPDNPAANPTFPTSARTIEVVATTADTPVSDPSSGTAIIGIAQLNASGIDSLRLEAGSSLPSLSAGGLIQFESSTRAHPRCTRDQRTSRRDCVTQCPLRRCRQSYWGRILRSPACRQRCSCSNRQSDHFHRLGRPPGSAISDLHLERRHRAPGHEHRQRPDR